MQEVKIKIRGLQAQGTEQEEPIEVVSVGQMYEEDGFVCIKYDEITREEENGLVQTEKNLLKIKDTQVEIMKSGPSANHLVFVPNRTTFTYYSTPVGELEVSIHTSQVEKKDYQSGFLLELQYELEMNQMFISTCNVGIAVEY